MMYTKTFEILSRGRKYFGCTLNGKYKAQLVINDVTQHLEVGSKAEAEVVDCSSQSRYGTTLCFRATRLYKNDTEVSQEGSRRKRFAEASKWLGYAEGDVQKGWYKSNAIERALQDCPEHEDLAHRLQALRDNVESNKKARDRARWLKREIDRLEYFLSDEYLCGTSPNPAQVKKLAELRALAC